MTTASPTISSTAAEDGQQLARGALANFFVLIAANFRGVFTFLIARLLGEAALGAFGLMFTITDLLSKPSTLGLEEGMVPLVARRRVAVDGVGARRVFRQGTIAAVMASAIVAVLGIVAIEWLVRVHGFRAVAGGMSIMLLSLPGITVARLSTAASRGMLALRNEFYSRGITETAITIVTFVVAIVIGLRTTAPAIAVVVGSTAGAVVAFVLARRVLRRAPGSDPAGRVTAGEAVVFATPIAGSGLLNVLMINLDVLILGAYVGHAPGVTPEAFGAFCAAAEVAGGMRKVRQVFDPVFAPVAAARDVSSDPLALRDTVEGPGRWVLAAQLPLVGALALESGAVMSIYGSAFRQGALWLALLAIAHGTNSFAGLVETLMIVKRPTLNVVNATATVAVQAIASWLLIPRLGATGAALAMGLGFVVQAVLRFMEMRHVFGWSWPWHSLRRPVIAFTAAMVPALAIRLTGGLVAEVVSGVVFLLGYAGCWLWLGADPTDREIWRQLRAPRTPPMPVTAVPGAGGDGV